MLGTVTRAGKALDLFTPDAPTWGATAMARELGVAKSQAHELLVSLSEIGLLRRLPGGQYRLGWRALELGRDVLRGQFPGDALRALRAFASQVREPVMLAVLDRGRPTVVARFGSNPATEALLPGEPLAPHRVRCAMTRCLLADLPERERREILARGTTLPFGESAVVLEDLERVRVARLAHDPGVGDDPLRSVAVPIKDADGHTMAALGAWSTAERWPYVGDQLTRAVQGAGRRVEAAMRPVEAPPALAA